MHAGDRALCSAHPQALDRTSVSPSSVPLLGKLHAAKGAARLATRLVAKGRGGTDSSIATWSVARWPGLITPAPAPPPRSPEQGWGALPLA
jgi:hypothetical protein